VKSQTNPAHRCRLYEKGWEYVPMERTDIRKTFARFTQTKPVPSNVQPLKRSAK
jgi:hypothetical protein